MDLGWSVGTQSLSELLVMGDVETSIYTFKAEGKLFGWLQLRR